MRKSSESELILKVAIRDIFVRDPLISVRAVQKQLLDRGFKTAQGNPLDWYYIAKVIRKLNREKALAVDHQKIGERLAITKERYRVIIEKLWRIIDYKWEYLELYREYPPDADQVMKAANTIIKLDLAILKAEMDAGIFERKLGTLDVKLPQLAPLDPEVAAQITEVFTRWGLDLKLPDKRPKLIEATAVDVPAQPTQDR
jgi:hypothetical protein